MTKIASFDCASGDAYVEKNLGAQSHVVLSAEAWFTPACLTAISGGGGSSANFLNARFFGLVEGPFVDNEDFGPGQPFQWWDSFGLANPVGLVPTNCWVPVVMEFVYDTGTLWNVSLTVGGITVMNTSIDLFVDDTAAFVAQLGGRFAVHAANEVYYFRNLLITNGATTLFSDDFASGTFAAWDTTVGSATVIDDPFLPVPMKVAVFDASSGDVFITKATGGLGTAILRVELDVIVPADTISALNAGVPTGDGALLVNISGDGGTSDGVRVGHPGGAGALRFYSPLDSSPPNNVPVVGGQLETISYIISDFGGAGAPTDPEVTQVDIGGVTVQADNIWQFGDPGTGYSINVGALASAALPGEVYYVAAVRIYDDLTPILDEDFTSGSFATHGWSVTGSPTIIDWPIAPPTPAASRFYEGFPWRFIFTKVDVTDPDNPIVVETTTWATDLLSNRQVSMALGASTSIEADVWPDDFRVNGIYDDLLPRIAQTKRMVLAFRREGSYADPNQPDSNGPWHIKAIGQLLSPSDDGGPDVPVTHFVAYDSRTYLGARPAMMDDGSLPDPQNGFPAIDTGDQIALAMLKNTIVNEGGVFIDAGTPYGGTAFYSGTLETTGDVAMTISAGQSVADVWDALEQAGNCDIVLTAIYDPINRPGYTHEVSIYNLAGDDKYEVVMGWDELNHCINQVQRVHDGTPGNFFDKVQAYAGQGGVPVPAAGPLVNAAAVTAFGSWWLMQFFPSMLSTDPTASAVFLLATQALELAKQGRRTLTINVITELAPIVLRAYGLGDRINIHATDRLRASLDGLQRVQAIPIQIPDDGVGEQLAALLTSPDYRSAPGT